MIDEYRLIGKDFVPPDITGKVTGKAMYAEDFKVDGMVFALSLIHISEPTRPY